ncbi:MAG: metallophosphoesterase [Gemmataceae bacterium]
MTHAYLLTAALLAAEAEPFRVLPYLQSPSQDAITVRWLSEKGHPGVLTVKAPDGARTYRSSPALAGALVTNPFGKEPGGPPRPAPYLHSVRVTGLRPGTSYDYSVRQDDRDFRAAFRTAPTRDQPIRFVVYSDCETEPESSTTDPVEWPPSPGSNRPKDVTRYFVNQTVGYRENLKVVAARRPDFVAIPGDLVEAGGKQRDWDEFWRHNAGDYGTIAARVPILPALGNHENFAGPGAMGGYGTAASNFATAKYLTYFEVPRNRARDPNHEARYYRLDYGPITLITLDTSDGLPAGTAADTNHNPSGSHAPDFNPGSEQGFRWLALQLADARKKSSVHLRAVPPPPLRLGAAQHSVGKARLSRPGRHRHPGPAAVAGPVRCRRRLLDMTRCWSDPSAGEGGPGGRQHPKLRDPLLRRRDRRRRAARAVGGVRQPLSEVPCPRQRPRARGRQLLSGGKHYGHVEVNIDRGRGGRGRRRSPPAVFPLTDAKGAVAVGWERRPYPDLVVLTTEPGQRREGFSGLAPAVAVVLLGALGLMVRRARKPLRGLGKA